ncbi:hypothetical protein ERJ75_000707900 [Trypanosoma vivax]|uniref:Uncharacterized protein n=1 Tax=Trypanosoma vivax (strain Y486) TaxID=1055687 RepID=G0TTZ8_TRYVY|nr:hypothetical protein TRVL_04809 [Trypanosoma vivax]KAH8614215.1 hypothetical protein ERJ75_000707900 [Trypanosoma vivax]CCC47431.1 conserved hypothetical protein [Trypanosoma vivax Y486]
MALTPYDDIIEIERRCRTLRESLEGADDETKMVPSKRYLRLCQASGESPNPVFLQFTSDASMVSLDLHRSYLSQRALMPIILTLPLCNWLEHIDLREERLTTTLIELLCEAVQGLPRLKTIDVSGNPFGSFGVRALLRQVLRNKHIVDCRVDGVQCTGSLLRRLHMACERNSRYARLPDDQCGAQGTTPDQTEPPNFLLSHETASLASDGMKEEINRD